MAKNKNRKGEASPEQDPGKDAEQDPGKDAEQDPGKDVEQDPGKDAEKDPRPPVRKGVDPPGRISYLPGPGSPAGTAVDGMASLRRHLNLSESVSTDHVAQMATARIAVLEKVAARASGKTFDPRSESRAAQFAS